jgi:endonuclease/exonuclease/phosphatase family metal-dependent hydrolase
MRRRGRHSPISPAPNLFGAFFLLAVFGLGGCRERPSEDWPGDTLAEEIEVFSAREAKDPAASADDIGLDRPPGRPSFDADHLRFVSHNLRNWLTMEVATADGISPRPKPEEEKRATTTVLVRHRPDILGVCEIGGPADLAELRSRLRDGGVDLPHIHHTGGADPERRLALLSRFPIASSERHEDLAYRLDGRILEMSRGILDVTLDTPVGELRFLGLHLKSKRETPEADQARMRLAEAHLARALADRILDAEPGTRLIVYGDLNDTRNAPAVRTIRGPGDGPRALKTVGLRDSRGQTWTYHWDRADIYSRIDFILVSESVRGLGDWDASYVVDDPETALASDHRPLVLALRVR